MTTRTIFKAQSLGAKNTKQAFTCCASLGKHFFVGTKDGCIILFELKVKSGSTEANMDYEASPREIVRVSKPDKANTAPDQIAQICPFREPRMMLASTESGALYFIPQLDVNLQLKRLEFLRNVHVHRMACKKQKNDCFVALQVRKGHERQLLILRLDPGKFEWQPFLPAPSVLPDDVVSMTWSGNILVLGFPREYSLFDVTTQQTRTLAKAGQYPPVMGSMFPMRETYCSLDDLLLAINSAGDVKEAKATVLKTRLPASAVLYSHPYALALIQSESAIQVHFPWYAKDQQRETLCQPLVIKNAFALSACPAIDFDIARPRDQKPDLAGNYRQLFEPDVVIAITNDNAIYLLDASPTMDQVRTLYRMSMFEDAGLLAELSPHQVQNSVRAELALNHANHLINERKPQQAFKLLASPVVSVQSVLRFFPDEYRLPELIDVLNQALSNAGIKLPDANASIFGPAARFLSTEEASMGDKDSERFRQQGLEELQKYLMERRQKLASTQPSGGINFGGDEGGGRRFGFQDPGSSDMMMQQRRQQSIMKLEDLRLRGDLETKRAALIDTALLIVSADRCDDQYALELLLREHEHRCILEPCVRFLAIVGADAVLVALLRAANNVETALAHLRYVAAMGRSPDGSGNAPSSLIQAKELSDLLRRRMDSRAMEMATNMDTHGNATPASPATSSSGGDKFTSGGGGVGQTAAAEENWSVESLTRAHSLSLVKKYRPECRTPEKLARQVTAVLAAFSLVQTQILQSSTTRSGMSTGVTGAVGSTTSSLGANPFQKLGCMWLFSDDALPDSFLVEQLFSGNRPLIAPRAIADFVTSPALRSAFIEQLLDFHKEAVQTSAHVSLQEEELRDLHNLMITAFLDRHKRDGARDQSVAKRLFDFVSTTTAYDPAGALDQIMGMFGVDSALSMALVDTKAELLARCTRFEDAVDVLFSSTTQAGGQVAAERFCRRVRDSDPKARSFRKLLEKSMERAGGRNSAGGVQEGIRLLTANPWVDPKYIWDLLPDNMLLCDLKDYLALALQDRSYRAHRTVLHGEILRAALLQRQVALSKELCKSAEVSSETTCGVCGRKIQSSLLARFPNGHVVHHACAPDEHVCPVTRVNFASAMPAVADAMEKTQ